MADSDVNIVGLDGVAPPMWATEQTLADMLGKIDNLVSITKDQKREIGKAIKGSSGGPSQTDKKKDAETKKATNLLGKLSSGLQDSTKNVLESAAGFDNLPGPMNKFGKALKETSGATKIAALTIGMIGNQVGKAISTIKESVNTLRDLSDSGIRLEGDFMSMQRGLAESGMTIAEFGEMVQNNANVVNRFGFKELAGLGRKVHEVTGGFGQWGLKLNEGTQITAELIDQQRRSGIFRELDAQKQAGIVEDVMNQMTAYSKVLNVSRKEMLESAKEMMADREYQFRISQMGAAERENFESGMRSVSNATVALGDAFDPFMAVIKETAVHDLDVQSKAYTRLLETGQVELANFLAMVGNTSREGRKWTMQEIGDGIKAAQERKAANEALFRAGGENAEVVMDITAAGNAYARALDQIAENQRRGGEDYQNTVSDSVETLANFDSALDRWQATAEYLRTDIFMDLIGGTGKDAMEKAILGLNSMSDKMLEFADSGITEDIGAWIREHWVAAFAVAATGLSAFSRAIPGTISALGSFSKWAIGAARAGSAAATAAGTSRAAGAASMLGRGLMIGGAKVLGAGAAGYAAGSLINNVGKLWGGRQLSTTILDRFTNFNDYDPNSEELSPEQQQVVARAKERRAEAERQRVAAEKATGAANATASQTVTEGETANAATPTMSEADIAKLSVAERNAYLAAENLRVLKSIDRKVGGDVF